MERWSRQTILPELGVAGQQRLLAARVLCIGTGALGSPATMYLAAAGVGTLVIVDPDLVESSNLQRQILHGEAYRGLPKVESAAQRLRDLHPDLRLELHACRFTPDNAGPLSEGCDLIIDGSDNFPTRFLTNDIAYFRKIPLVHAAVQRFEGQMTVFAPHLGGPCYRCMLPTMPPHGSIPNCAESGVIGALPGVMGSLQAMEALKLIAGIGQPAIGKMIYYHSLTNHFRQIQLHPDPTCRLCSSRADITSVHNAETQQPITCTMNHIPSITVQELYQKLTATPGLCLIDVREPQEHADAAIQGSTLVPLATVPDHLHDWSPDQEMFIHCKAGGRSARAVEFLQQQGFTNVTNIAGGMDAWIAAGLPVA